MRQNVKEILRLITKSIDLPEPIIEIGSFQVEGLEELADLRPLFPGKEFIGCDMRQGRGVDRIENVEGLSFQDESVGTIICMDTLEHVRNILLAKSEMHRVLKPDGFIIISSVMYHPIHDYPFDYWRFTPEAFNFLLDSYTSRRIFYQGFHEFPHTVFGIGSNQIYNLENISTPIINNEPLYTFTHDTMINIYERKTIPVYFLRFARKCARNLLTISLRLQYLEDKRMNKNQKNKGYTPFS